jgi:hypothetical protein
MFAATLLLVVFGVIGSALIINNHNNAHAISAVDFNAGRIIDDAVFYNKDAMNTQEIQSFLNTLVPSCDTWGTNKSGRGNLTNAQYAQQQGWAGPPYVCISNYYENPTTNETSFEKGGGAFDGGLSAAQIIYNASQQYNISPQVLLVMLKKESSGPLTADSWPLKSQYKYAMGYACPDSGANNSANCDSAQAGFYKQIMKAAWQLNYYKNHVNDYRYRLGTNQIQYSTDTNCGTKTVNIENVATLSLYIYTPYTPNNGSLSNYPGTSSCGSYGNRNFFMYFNEWFGSTYFDGVKAQKNAVWRLYNPQTGGHMISSDFNEVNTYLLHKWINDGVVSHSSDNGVLSVHRLYNPRTKYHTTATDPEVTLLKSQGWIDDGEIFKSPSSGNPVWRLSKNGDYFVTSNVNEISAYLKDNWGLDGVVYYEQSQNENSVWRLYNKITNTHTFVSSASELTDYLRAGWINDGIIMSNSKADTLPVYRLWNGKSHFITANEGEKDAYVRAGWKNDGIIFYATSDTSRTPVYRLWNGKSHFITANEGEKDAYVRAGWKNDGIIFYTSNTIIANRLYNSTTGARRIVTDLNTIYMLFNEGWTADGSAIKGSSFSNVPVYELYNTSSKSFFYTSNTQESTTYKSAGWQMNGVLFYAAPSGIPVYRLYSQNLQKHILVQDSSEKQNLINSGWINDGVVFNAYS